MNAPRICLILARARNGVIGRDNALPWRLPEDMTHFRELTMGHPVLMGRKTWESLPPKFRPLPGRRNLVLTRDADWSADGAERFDSVDAAVAACAAAGANQLWVIGGAQVYAASVPYAQRVAVTEIDADFEGDAHAPAFEAARAWRHRAGPWQQSATGLRFRFDDWTLD